MKYALTCLLIIGSFAAFAQTGAPSAWDIRNGIAGEIKSFKIPAEPVVRVVSKNIWTSTDSVPIRIYYPSNQKSLPIIFNIHGGALVAGDLDTHDNICRILANKTKAIVIALDYRKPPEHPYPASLNDCYNTLQWIADNVKTLGGNKNKLFIIGDSGGGLLASALILKLGAEKSKVSIKGIALINPAEDLRTPGGGLYGLVTKWYLNGADATDPLVSPIMAKSVSDFPQSLIIVCEKDELKPHGVDFYNKLKASGNQSLLIEIPNEGHLGGYWSANHPKAGTAVNAVTDFITKLLK